MLPNTYRAFYGAFERLYPIQQRAIEPILRGRDVIIQSATGSGKTEAVLAPCLERVITAAAPASILYLVPTRALAVDIFRRFQPLLTERLDLAVAIRTGDAKKKGGGSPTLMLSTPESLDVMLGSANRDLSEFIARINTVVIDEVHPLIHHYRGHQLVYLLQRLERRRGRRLQKIALSATLGDPEEVRRFLDLSADTACLVETVSRQIIPRLVHLKNDANELTALIDDLYHQWDYRKILIFANSRGRCDKIFGVLNRSGIFRGRALLHYSNLSARQRREVERRFRKQSRAICIATSTLELGIDVGDVDAVVLFEPPDSATAFLQRIGRANRRKAEIHFWGICRGERSGEQVLRFLALLFLARQGRVENPLPKRLPSVLSQQIISCLYEKKQISLEALKNLFAPDDSSGNVLPLDVIFASLVAQRWLRATRINKIYRGGWRYGDALLEHRIWSNFPETEQEYSLIVSGEVVADIPRSIVKQLNVGDRVLLTGRRLHILWINEGRRHQVLAEPTEERLDAKEIMWIGMGCHVSLETAQAMRDVLKSQDPADNLAAYGLFARTRKLIEKQLATGQRAVTLANSIEVVLTAGGLYQYRTYLGAVGNMILVQSIKEYFAQLSEDVYLLYDEIGLTCSAWVCFEKLALPLAPKDFDTWIARHLQTIRAMFPLNAFCSTLPPELLRRELTDFILDPRLIEIFQKYKRSSCDIVKGDPRHLESAPEAYQDNDAESVEIAVQRQPLLTREKERHGENPPAVNPNKALFRARPLTGTIIGDYFRHRQCRRRLCYQFLTPEDQPTRPSREDDPLAGLRMSRGLAFEAKILDELQSFGRNFQRISERDERGKLLSFESRWEETRVWLRRACRQDSGDGKRYLAQGVLLQDGVLSPPPDRFAPWPQGPLSLKGIGIPDLICAVRDGKDFRIEVGDIKSTPCPRYHQKWQIAFYAHLLNLCLRREENRLPAPTAETGFLLVRSPLDDAPQRHSFDLRPYLAAINALFRNLEQCLSTSPQNAFWRLQPHCVSCPYFEFCYRQALAQEDIQFIPQLSHGELLKLRALGLHDISSAAAWFADPDSAKQTGHPPSAATPAAALDGSHAPVIDTRFSPEQEERLQTAVHALIHNKICLEGQKTQLFPADTKTCFFVHLLNDPLTMLPMALGLGLQASHQKPQIFTWVSATGSNLTNLWDEFSDVFLKHWRNSVAKNGAPHIFLFDEGVRRQIYEWAALLQNASLGDLFREKEPACWTDLTQTLRNHFALPIPGNMTRYALACVLGLDAEQKLDEPDSLWHGDRFAGLKIEDGNSAELEAYLTTLITFDVQLFQWITSRLESDRRREPDGEPLHHHEQNMGDIYLRLIETEQTHQTNDIQRLQVMPLAQRVARFRALGPLNFTGTELDEEGRFLYLFTLADSADAGRSKFRRGDFLKLVPPGIKDLQSGIPVIMARYDAAEGLIALHSRQKGNIFLNKTTPYSLEEDADDWNTPKLIDVVQQVYAQEARHPAGDVLAGRWDFTHPAKRQAWVGQWLANEGRRAGLNPSQQTALKLPFQYALSLIQGPPGTGKTNLLGWILIALVRHAKAHNIPLRIVVSALTHQAIDQVLTKVVNLVNTHNLNDFPARCWKLGAWEGPAFDENNDALQVEPIDASQPIALPAYLILGATGYGLYNLRRKSADRLPDKPFDWVIFDEASQLLVPQALLSLIHGKGNYLFLGDIHQLPPVIRSARPHRETTTPATASAQSEKNARLSLLEILMRRYPRQNAFLETTYRMNAEICAFPSRTWYDARLHPAPEIADVRLTLGRPIAMNDPLDNIIDPAKPVVLVRADHLGCGQESGLEADILARIAHHLLCRHHLAPEQLAVISPHRAQNNAIGRRLSELLQRSRALPLIDTVERIQGAERDVILFGLTCSDPDQVLSEFLNNPNRFNVAITRARQKLIVVCSEAFISAVAHNEQALTANACFKAFFEHVGAESNIVWHSNWKTPIRTSDELSGATPKIQKSATRVQSTETRKQPIESRTGSTC